MPDLRPTDAATGPLRTCVGCRARAPQHRLRRCVLAADGSARVDRNGPGRGAWVCSAECVDRATRRHGFARAWRANVPAGTLDDLRRAVAEAFTHTTIDMRDLRPAGSVAGMQSPTKG